MEAVVFIFPAFVANAAPTILGKGKRFNAPIDGGRYWKDNWQAGTHGPGLENDTHRSRHQNKEAICFGDY